MEPNLLGLEFIYSNDQIIHCEVYNNKGDIAFYLSAIYAHNNISKRKDLWENIEDHNKHVKGPWLIIGDYNNVLKIADRIGWKEIQHTKYVELESMMQTVGLTEHATRGNHTHGQTSMQQE